VRDEPRLATPAPPLLKASSTMIDGASESDVWLLRWV
jgi:hypothetical protein